MTESTINQRRAIYDLLRQRDFVLLWVGQLFSQIGDQCLLIAAITLVTDLSDSPLGLLIPAISIALPQVFFGLLGGVAADRFNRKYTMIVSDILRALLVLAILLVRTRSGLWILYLSASGLGMMGLFFYPARNAALPNLVSNGLLLPANGLIQGTYLMALILGPMVAGMIVELWSLPAAIIFDSLTFVVSAIIIATLHIPSNHTGAIHPAERKSMWHDMQAGLDFIRHNHHLRRVLYVTAVATVGIGSVVILAFPHLKSELEAGGLEYGGALSMLGVGALLGGLIASRLSRRVLLNVLIGSMLIAAGVAVIVFAWAPNYWVILGSVIILGLSVVATRAMLDTIAQALSPDDVRGRVQAAVNLIVSAGTALAEGASALLGHFLGTQGVFASAGVITVIAGIAAWYALQGAAQSTHAKIVSG